MAGRAATAVSSSKSIISKPRSAAKSPARVKAARAKAFAVSAPQGATATATATPAPKTKRRAKTETRTRIYWAVFNQDCKRVAVFEFDQKQEADKRAAQLSETSGEHHFVHKIKATVSV